MKIDDAIPLALQLMSLIQTAYAERRDITDEEIDSLVVRDDVARARLVAAIAQARAEGR